MRSGLPQRCGRLLVLLVLPLLVRGSLTILNGNSAQHQRTFKHTTALFGYPKYGREITGQIYYAGAGCTNNYPTRVAHNKLVMVDRGVCAFSKKVQVAEMNGAAAVIVVDNQPGNNLTMMMDPHQDADKLTIPSIFISYADGQWIKNNVATSGHLNAMIDWPIAQSRNLGPVRYSSD
jgi:hypothetical protein